jgi:hypothetical protein
MLPNGKLRVVYSKEENLMIIEFESGGTKEYYFYFVPDTDTLVNKGGKAGMAILCYGDKYWREIQEAQPVPIKWGMTLQKKLLK